MTEEHEVERVIKAVREVIIAMFSLIFAIIGLMRYMKSEHFEVIVIGWFLFLLMIWTIAIIVPLSFIEVMGLAIVSIISLSLYFNKED